MLTEKAKLVLVDGEPTFQLENGTVIESNAIGYVAHNYGESEEDTFYDKFTKNDILFIEQNDIVCHIEMQLGEDSRVPKLYKGKVIVHFNN